jgi:hypothetical protein
MQNDGLTDKVQNEQQVIRFMPSNGTEGMIFVDNFCLQCIHEKFMHTQNHDDRKCEIFDNSLLNDRPCFNKDLKLDGWEWFMDKDCQNWECKQWQKWDWGNDPDDLSEPPEPPPYDPNQLLLFTFDEKIDELIKEQRHEYV